MAVSGALPYFRFADRPAGLFWSLPKRYPSVVEFDGDDVTHVEFVAHTARLWAQVMFPSFGAVMRVTKQSIWR